MPYASELFPELPPGAPPQQIQQWAIGFANTVNTAIQRGWQLQHVVSMPGYLVLVFLHN
jgi:hypothetical protein